MGPSVVMMENYCLTSGRIFRALFGYCSLQTNKLTEKGIPGYRQGLVYGNYSSKVQFGYLNKSSVVASGI